MVSNEIADPPGDAARWAEKVMWHPISADEQPTSTDDTDGRDELVPAAELATDARRIETITLE